MTPEIHEQEKAFYGSHTFKRQELQPLSQGRKDVLMSIGIAFDGRPIALMDMHTIMFTLLADRKTLATAHRNPDAYAEKVFEWVDANLTEDDYTEEVRIINDVLTGAFKTKASAIPEPETVGNEMGNSQGQ